MSTKYIYIVITLFKNIQSNFFKCKTRHHKVQLRLMGTFSLLASLAFRHKPKYWRKILDHMILQIQNITKLIIERNMDVCSKCHGNKIQPYYKTTNVHFMVALDEVRGSPTSSGLILWGPRMSNSSWQSI